MTYATYLKSLTKNARRYLSGYACGLCDRPLHMDGCGRPYLKCTDEVRIIRAKKCMEGYKPRRKA